MSALRLLFITSYITSLILNLLLLPYFIRFKHIPGLFTLFWLIVSSFVYGLNAIAFDGETLPGIPVYCDVGKY